MTITTPSPTTLKELLISKITEKCTKEAQEQKWLGAYTNKQRQNKQMPPTANQILKKWTNIPDIVYSVNKTIRQQLLPTKTYQQSKGTDDHHRHKLWNVPHCYRINNTCAKCLLKDRLDPLHSQARLDVKAVTPLLNG